MRLPDGTAEWHAVLRAPAGVRHPAPVAETHRRSGRRHDPIPTLPNAVDPASVLHHDPAELTVPLRSFPAARTGCSATPPMTPSMP
ncbi:hypothetical protein [Streptomyces sp. MUM 178J]|uniref:hypothetical protein n=1 Tax=Streptomyces sp. MUM 178J TaxID=2791991 RepID=UPI002E7C2E3D|nr:hypothetical protein [Streptomyces sp. MUM 178J]WRQ82645.1 hypothetical protein I3F59_026675 [Streptomyces sp. MUM 178J]